MDFGSRIELRVTLGRFVQGKYCDRKFR